MDPSPLIKGHDHAKSAALATESTVAVNEHSLAAGEFAAACSETRNLEASRTLKLLEQHHKRLSEILKSTTERSPPAPSSPDRTSAPSSPLGSELKPHSSTDSPVQKHVSQPVPSLQPHRPPVHPRDVGSSIASNLASARGIRAKRGQALSPTVTKDPVPGSIDGQSVRRDHSALKTRSGKPSWTPPADKDSSEGVVVPSPTTPGDDGYARFSNIFGHLINTLSAPLAFAGLPLNPTEQEPEPEPPVSEPPSSRKKKTRQAASTSAEPDLKKIYSKATLRAVSRDGSLTSDSFYVVPTSGHTMSYANILNFAEKEKRRQEASRVYGEMSEIPEDLEDDDFVDARETQTPLPPAVKKRVGRTQGDKELRNAVEELFTENQNLKEMLDKVTKRLHAFEASAQTSSMRLAESMRLMRPTSPASSGGGQSEAEAARRKELERRLMEALSRVEELERENAKQDRALIKYREKWEKLKAGAKARREAQNSLDAMPEPRPSK